MSEISVTINDKTPELMQKLDAAIGRFVFDAAFHIDAELRSAMEVEGTGRIYKRGNSFHQASAPGQSPVIDQNNLIGSIQQIFPSTLEAKIGTPVEYALYLEEGTDRMAERPLWEKTATDSLPTLEKMLNDVIEGIR